MWLNKCIFCVYIVFVYGKTILLASNYGQNSDFIYLAQLIITLDIKRWEIKHLPTNHTICRDWPPQNFHRGNSKYNIRDLIIIYYVNSFGHKYLFERIIFPPYSHMLHTFLNTFWNTNDPQGKQMNAIMR